MIMADVGAKGNQQSLLFQNILAGTHLIEAMLDTDYVELAVSFIVGFMI